MSTLVQDYKSWKNARSKLKKLESDLNEYRQSITKYVSAHQMASLLKAMQEFADLLPTDKNQPDYAEKYVAIYEQNKKNIRAPYCFFKISVIEPVSGFVFNSDEINRCPNNHKDGHIEDFACKDCPHFEEITKYQSLVQDVTNAKQEKINAKQKFMSNFGIQR